MLVKAVSLHGSWFVDCSAYSLLSQAGKQPSQTTRPCVWTCFYLSVDVGVCVCVRVYLKLDSSESVPTTKFTRVLAELSGLPSQSGGDRQCISSLSY